MARYTAKALTATGVVGGAGRGVLVGASLLAGTDAATALVRDGTVAGDPVIAVLGAAAGLSDHWSAPGAGRGETDERVSGARFDKGLFVSLTGASPTCVVYFV